jgi:hypothetical protein
MSLDPNHLMWRRSALPCPFAILHQLLQPQAREEFVEVAEPRDSATQRLLGSLILDREIFELRVAEKWIARAAEFAKEQVDVIEKALHSADERHALEPNESRE